jgi:hypothetical protein
MGSRSGQGVLEKKKILLVLLKWCSAQKHGLKKADTLS